MFRLRLFVVEKITVESKLFVLTFVSVLVCTVLVNINYPPDSQLSALSRYILISLAMNELPRYWMLSDFNQCVSCSLDCPALLMNLNWALAFNFKIVNLAPLGALISL